MPTPFEVITKPLQLGAQVVLGAIENIQKLLNGDQPAPPREQPEPKRRPPRPKQLDDVTITRKVETILFRGDDVDKGKISVNTAHGVVSLRGEAKTPQQIKQLEAQARAVPEVKDVENLLHLPKTPARRATRSKAAAARKPAPKRTTSERRKPAPLGSTNGGGES